MAQIIKFPRKRVVMQEEKRMGEYNMNHDMLEILEDQVMHAYKALKLLKTRREQALRLLDQALDLCKEKNIAVQNSAIQKIFHMIFELVNLDRKSSLEAHVEISPEEILLCIDQMGKKILKHHEGLYEVQLTLLSEKTNTVKQVSSK